MNLASAKSLKTLFLSVLMLGVLAVSARAQYSISWHKVAGGGGTSTNGQYFLSGTIGQHDAGALSGGNYILTGGFWGIISAVQTPGAPTLYITRTNAGSVRLSWAVSPTPFYLQDIGSLSTTNWLVLNTNTYPVSVINGTNNVTVPATGNMFFRLRYP